MIVSCAAVHRQPFSVRSR